MALEKDPLRDGRTIRPFGGCKFVRRLSQGETWIRHPSGNGLIIAHPDRAPTWLHDADGMAVETPIEVT